MTRPRWTASLAAAGLAGGCFTEPERDERFSLLSDEERPAYARARVEEANQAVAGGATMGVLGLVAIGTGIYLAVKDGTGDSVGSEDERTLHLLYAGGGLLAAGIPIATKGLKYRGLWGEFAGRGEAPRVRAAVRFDSPSGTLYLPAGEPLPPGCEGLAVVRVSGPADPAVRRLASRIPALRWPVLERPVLGGDSALSVGTDAVGKSLAGLSPEALH